MQITLVLLTFNQAPFVKQAALACLNQICEPIEILFSDDASTDNTFSVLQDLAAGYTGPHHLIVRRNDRNLGIGLHYNRMIELAQGELIITAAGDDVSLPHRVQRILDAWRGLDCKPDLISSYLVDMQFDGALGKIVKVDDLTHWRSGADWVAKRPLVIGAAHAFTKRLHRHFGPFEAELAFEDQAMSLRAACLGGGYTISEPLLHYRRGGISGLQQQFTHASAYLKYIQRRHALQLGMYAQIQKDLATAGRSDLFFGKFSRRLARARVFVAMMNASTPATRRTVFFEEAFDSIASFFAALHAYALASFPDLFMAFRRALAK